MWPFRRRGRSAEPPTPPAPSAPVPTEVATQCAAIVADYLLMLPGDGQWSDRDLHQRLIGCGHDRHLAWGVIAMVPNVAGRMAMAHLGIRFPDQMEIHFRDRTCSAPIALRCFAPFVAAEAAHDLIARHPNITALSTHGCEFDVVHKLARDPADAKNVILTPIALLDCD